jgi:hypothetical protein
MLSAGQRVEQARTPRALQPDDRARALSFREVLRAAALTAMVGALALTSDSASAATVVGSDLATSTDTAGYCSGDGPGTRCTVLQLTLGTVDQAVRADGVITRWAVRDARGALALKVIEGAAGQRHVVASSAPVQASPSGVQAFPAQIPVRAGQRIGVEIGEDGALPFIYRDERTTGEEYDPPLGEIPAPPVAGAALSSIYEISYNATIERDLDVDGLGDETQDPDHGGVGAGAVGCPVTGVIARGSNSVVYRRAGGRVFGCRDGRSTLVGTQNRHVRFRLPRLQGDRLALVRVADGRSSIQVYDLHARRRTFSSSRTSNGGRPTSWTVSDLVVTSNGNAAWISTMRGARARTTVWVRNARRVQQVDQGRIAPTSLTLADNETGIYYIGADGRQRNSGF